MRLRRLSFLLLLLLAGGVSYAAAATLTTGSKQVGAGKAVVPICDTDGFTYTRTLDASHNVTSVTVSGINAACNGGTLQLTLADGANASLGSGSAAVTTSGSATITITGTAPAASVASYKSAIAT
jgi:hypothetical protein